MNHPNHKNPSPSEHLKQPQDESDQSSKEEIVSKAVAKSNKRTLSSSSSSSSTSVNNRVSLIGCGSREKKTKTSSSSSASGVEDAAMLTDTNKDVEPTVVVMKILNNILWVVVKSLSAKVALFTANVDIAIVKIVLKQLNAGSNSVGMSLVMIQTTAIIREISCNWC